MNKLWLPSLRLAVPRVLLLLLLVLLGVSLALLPWKWAALLVLGSIGLMVLIIQPQYGLCLLAFAIPFASAQGGILRSIPGLSLGAANVGATELLIPLLLGFWLARMVAARRIVVPHAFLLLPICFFIVAILFSTLSASSFELSAKEIVKWLEVLGIYLFMAGTVDDRGGRLTVWALLAAGSAEAMVGIYQFLRGIGPEGFVLFGRFMRAYGHFAQPNPFAGYLGLSIPLAYALTLRGLQMWRTWGVPKTPRPGPSLTQLVSYVVPVASFLLMLAAMSMSWSRGGWVGLAAALLVITVVRSRRALFVAIAVGLLVAYLLLIGGAQYLPPALMQRVTGFLPYLGGIDVSSVEVTDANWAIVERMAHWQAALAMFSDHPWLGVGIGNYAVAYPQYALGRWRDPLGHAHNYYLNIAAEAGVIGLGAYIILVVACFAQAWRVMQRTKGYWRAVALGTLGVLVHLSVHNLFDNLYVHSMNVQLALVLGLLCVAEKSVDA